MTTGMTENDIFSTLTDYMEHIQPGERIRYHVPKELYITRDELGDEDWDWEFIEEIQMFVRGNFKHENLFVTLKFKGPQSDLLVDMYFLPK